MTARFAYTPTEASKMLGVSVSSIYRAMKRGEIAYETVSGRKLIRARDLVERFGAAVEDSAA